MAATTILIVAADNGGTVAAVPVAIALNSTALGILNAAGASVQRVRATATAADGTLSLPVDPSSDLSDAASTYTITVGSETYANLVVPASGTPITLASLVATAVSHTVAITLDVIDPSELPDAGLLAPASLSIDSINLSGRQVLAQLPVPATSDSTGLLTWHLDRTDQLAPVGGGPEPYYAFIVGSSTYYRYVRGAGSLSGLPAAIPTSSSGGFGATASGIAAVENAPTGLHGSPASVQDVLDDAIYLAGHAIPADATTAAVGGVRIDAAPSGPHPVAATLDGAGLVRPGVLPVATPVAFGVVRPDGTTVTVSGGVLTAAGGGAAAPSVIGPDGQVPSADLPTPAGTSAELARWTGGASPLLIGTQTWEGDSLQEPNLLFDGTTWHLFYTGGWSNPAMGHATCPGTADPMVGSNWTKHTGPVLGQGAGGVSGYVAQTFVLWYQGTFYCYYADGVTGNIRAATSADGNAWTLQGIMVANSTAPSWATQQWANSAIARKPDGTWAMLLEGISSAGGAVWKTGLLTAPALLGPWALDTAHSPLSTLQAGTGAYGGPWLMSLAPQFDGLYEVWEHTAPSGVVPTNIYRYSSPDLITWTLVGQARQLSGTGYQIDQVADPSVCEVYGKSYFAFSGVHNSAQVGAVYLTTFAGTLHQLVRGSPLPGEPGGTATLGSDGILTPAQRPAGGGGGGAIYGPLVDPSGLMIRAANGTPILAAR